MTKHVNSYLLFFFLVFLCVGCAPDTSCYYLDAVNGNDNNNGHSEQAAWKSLSKLQSLQLKPGDRILLKRGDTYSANWKSRDRELQIIGYM